MVSLSKSGEARYASGRCILTPMPHATVNSREPSTPVARAIFFCRSFNGLDIFVTKSEVNQNIARLVHRWLHARSVKPGVVKYTHYLSFYGRPWKSHGSFHGSFIDIHGRSWKFMEVHKCPWKFSPWIFLHESSMITSMEIS